MNGGMNTVRIRKESERERARGENGDARTIEYTRPCARIKKKNKHDTV